MKSARPSKTPPPRIRKTRNLHLGRISRPGTRYFVTLVTHNRTPWLIPVGASLAKPAESPAHPLLQVLHMGHDAGDWQIHLATCMPDHLHVLLTLGSRLSIGQTVARWKFQTRQAVGTSHKWQRDFWEHRLIPGEDHEDYGLYTFLNPYRANLIPTTVPWPWTWIPDPLRFHFTTRLLSNGTPPFEWTGQQTQERFRRLKTHSSTPSSVGASLAKPAESWTPQTDSVLIPRFS